MTQTLYRIYRPKSFSEVVGQEPVVRTLEGALLSGRIGHAYLFCGPRGTGKTTIARLFAKALNCEKRLTAKDNFEPCNKCTSCLAINEGRSLDLIEVDAASNRGIDEIRNLKDSVRVAASSSQYKVFIVDEVHMLTPPAFNALLKTLEEPPSHVVFILATTEPHKILETILSRVQRFDFRKIEKSQIISKLKKIAKEEKIEMEPEVLTALADFSSGSMRDAESAMAKLISFSLSEGETRKITAQQTLNTLGIVPSRVHSDFLTAIIANNTSVALSVVADLHESGIDLDNFTKQFLHFARARLIGIVGNGTVLAESKAEADRLVKIINVFIEARRELRSSPVPQLPLELAVMELTRS
jgi:DNA polymerase-3 subunit gamma/tau